MWSEVISTSQLTVSCQIILFLSVQQMKSREGIFMSEVKVKFLQYYNTRRKVKHDEFYFNRR